jgi:hypothetical protein
MLPHKITKYLSSRAIQGPWQITGCTERGFSGAVVIPALAESAHLFDTLRSLADNPVELLSRFLVLVAVNNRKDTPDADKADNRTTLERLASGEPSLNPLRLSWVDAASDGLELPADKGGVGLARKIGFDLALPLLDFTSSDPFLVALDGDTLVQPDYLPALVRHFHSSRAGGAVIPFRHQPGRTPEESEAIRRYELFLRSYVLGLSVAGSPYAFHTVGSAMACTANAYAGIGGMNTRVAAEDFYFLQQLKKTSAIAQVTGTVVLPSARSSHRVPFGTGKSVSRLLAGEESAVLFYRPECFAILGKWLSLVEASLDGDGSAIRDRADGISPHLGEYLDSARFAEAWEKLRKNSRDRTSLLAAFHAWFDGLRTLKLVHHLSDGPLPRGASHDLLPPLLALAGLEALHDPDAQLALLRRIQSAGSVP